MISKQIILLVIVALFLALIQCAPRNLVVIKPAEFGKTTKVGELGRAQQANDPWWCDAAVSKCNGVEDTCCYNYWSSPQDACRSACAQCGRSC